MWPPGFGPEVTGIIHAHVSLASSSHLLTPPNLRGGEVWPHLGSRRRGSRTAQCTAQGPSGHPHQTPHLGLGLGLKALVQQLCGLCPAPALVLALQPAQRRTQLLSGGGEDIKHVLPATQSILHQKV